MTEIDLRDFDFEKSKDGGENVDITEKTIVNEEVVENEIEIETTEEEVEVFTEETVENKESDVVDFMKTPYDEVQSSFVEAFRSSHGEYAYIVQ